MLFKLINIKDYMVTRDIQLKNIETETIEICFDDSALVGIENFEFMKIGNLYDCKIMLFGDVVTEKIERAVKCDIINENIKIGNRLLVEVLVGKDIYYVTKKYLKKNSQEKFFLFRVSRKDLIQVDNIIHADFKEK